MIKENIAIVSVCFLLTIIVSFFIFNYGFNLSGFAVYNDSPYGSNSVINQTFIVTRSDAILAINQSEQIISEMQNNNFSIVYVSDRLSEAKRVFAQVSYAEVLKSDNASERQKAEASQALRLVDWKKISYSDVLVYTDEIKQRRDESFFIFDTLTVEQQNFLGASNETRQIFENAVAAFYDDRYNESEYLLVKFRDASEKEQMQSSSLQGIKIGAQNFVQRYWLHMIVVIIILLFVAYYTYKKFEKKLLVKKIKKLKTELIVLNDLMKKVQTERFRENKLSGLVYNIRMKKYNEREQEIKEELPVLEERLKKLDTLKNKDLKTAKY